MNELIETIYAIETEWLKNPSGHYIYETKYNKYSIVCNKVFFDSRLVLTKNTNPEYLKEAMKGWKAVECIGGKEYNADTWEELEKILK